MAADVVTRLGAAPLATAGAAAVLRERHGIAHATRQVEPVSSRECHELDW